MRVDVYLLLCIFPEANQIRIPLKTIEVHEYRSEDLLPWFATTELCVNIFSCVVIAHVHLNMVQRKEKHYAFLATRR